MARTMDDATLRQIRTLFGAGTSRGLSDGQLLERFSSRDGPGAEEAFAHLVERHGPMVHRVARSVLRDRHAAEDAFQAAFLALARRAGSLWVRDSIGPWLHAVTVRIASRMRADLARRRQIDDRAASLAPTSFEPGGPDDLGAALHEEIARLPDRHRQPIVLCLVEGLTHDEAARRLNVPVGTVRSRLARGRDRLRDRLARRGLSPSAMPIGLALARSAPGAVRASLLTATVRLAVSASHGGLIAATGAVPAGVVASALGILKELTMIQRAALVIGLVATGVLAAGASLSAQSKPESPPRPVISMKASKLSDERTTLTKAYAVADLVTAPAMIGTITDSAGGAVTARFDGEVDFNPLIDLITDSVAPGTWTTVEFRGGVAPSDLQADNLLAQGSIRAFFLNSSLIVSHSPEVHDEVAERLRQLRRIVGPLTRSADSRREPSDHPKAPEGDPEDDHEAEILSRTHNNPGNQDEESLLGRVTISGNPREVDTIDHAGRIESLERKLDAILEELRAIRNSDG